MGFWSRFLGRSGTDTYDAAQRVLPDPYEPFVGLASTGIAVADPGVPLATYTKGHVEAFWRSQPNVRKVVSFIARNVASVPLHVYERVSDTDRRRITDHPLAQAVSSPQPRVGAFRFWNDVLSDGLLYDRWALIKERRDDGGVDLVQVPSWRLHLKVDALRRVTSVLYLRDDESPLRGASRWKELALEDVVFDHGYAPRTAGLSPIDTLSDILAESAEAVTYRRQVWANGARAPQWISRPAEAKWSNEGRDRFQQGFRAAYTGDGENAGGVPLLEDGMQLHDGTAFAPQDAMDLEGRRLTAAEVASAFHVAPELVGAQQGNYSNIDAFRQMLYRDSLGPYITAWEQAINAMLTPELAGGRNLYVEAHIDAKLRGSFQEQAAVMSTATGRPWMTADEGRSRFNMPALGGDAAELVTPLNVLIGGQASPRDSGSQNESAGTAPATKAAVSISRESASEPLKIKAESAAEHEKAAQQVMVRLFKRQRVVVLSALGSKSDGEWWDEGRWNDELAADILALSLSVTAEVGVETLKSLGIDPDVYSEGQTVEFLKAVAASRAGAINSTTRDQIKAALAGDVGEDAETSTPAGVFDVAESSRAEQGGVTLATTLSAFAVTEAVKQSGRPQTTKTWIVTSSNPRSSHAAMNGETVPIDETFSNGMAWPGDATAGDAAEVANCMCSVEVTIP